MDAAQSFRNSTSSTWIPLSVFSCLHKNNLAFNAEIDAPAFEVSSDLKEKTDSKKIFLLSDEVESGYKKIRVNLSTEVTGKSG